MSATLASAQPPNGFSRPGAPVPRSEPPSDDELRAAGLQAPPMAAPALPLRMPTRRRRPSSRRAG